LVGTQIISFAAHRGPLCIALGNRNLPADAKVKVRGQITVKDTADGATGLPQAKQVRPGCCSGLAP
jgi:hypothetical protein